MTSFSGIEHCNHRGVHGKRALIELRRARQANLTGCRTFRRRVGRRFLLCLLVLLAGCAARKTVKNPPPQAPQGRSASDPMFQFRGTWQGRIDFFNAPRFEPSSKRTSMEIRFVIHLPSVRVFTRPVSNKTAPWAEVNSGQFGGQIWGSQAVLNSVTSGNDSDGLWIESISFTLVHDSPMTLVVYFIRAVNNLDLPVANPDAHFAWGGSGQFQRVDGVAQ